MGPRQPLSGTFDFVDMQPGPLFREFALADVQWVIVRTSSPFLRRKRPKRTGGSNPLRSGCQSHHCGILQNTRGEPDLAMC